jgi:hypothetical protein
MMAGTPIRFVACTRQLRDYPVGSITSVDEITRSFGTR